MRKTVLALATVLLMTTGSQAAISDSSDSPGSANTLTLENGPDNPITWTGTLAGGTAAEFFGVPVDPCRGPVVGVVVVAANCHVHALDVQARPPDADHTVALHVELTSDTPLNSGFNNDVGNCAVELFITPPWATAPTDVERLRCNIGIFPLPESGSWQFETRCNICEARTDFVVKAYATVVPWPDGHRPLGSPHFEVTKLFGSGGIEPRLDTDTEGRTFIATGASYAGASVWMIGDDGEVKRTSGLFPRQHPDHVAPGLSGIADLSVSPDGIVYALVGGGLPQFYPHVMVSRNSGVSYSTGGSFGPDADHATIAAGPNGIIYGFGMMLQLGPVVGGNRMQVYRSDDYGTTFLPQGNMIMTDATRDCVNGNHALVDPTDPSGHTVHYIYRASAWEECLDVHKSARPQLWHAVSENGGRNWTHHAIKTDTNTILTTYPTGDNAVMRAYDSAIDSEGNLYAVWVEINNPCPDPSPICNDQDREKDSRVMFSRSLDGGLSWSTRVEVDTRPELVGNLMPAITAPGNGRVDIAWYTSDAKFMGSETTRWSVAYARTDNANDDEPIFVETMVSKKAVHVGLACQSPRGPWCPLETGLDIDVGPDGGTRLAWADDVSGKPAVFFAASSGKA